MPHVYDVFRLQVKLPSFFAVSLYFHCLRFYADTTPFRRYAFVFRRLMLMMLRAIRAMLDAAIFLLTPLLMLAYAAIDADVDAIAALISPLPRAERARWRERVRCAADAI